MIRRVVEYTVNGVTDYTVMYGSCLIRNFDHTQQLPAEVLDFILSDKVLSETAYYEDISGMTEKVVKYKMAS